ncbi:MAG: hypothetical protein R2875_14160 [Desulfobacterales bacterium]
MADRLARFVRNLLTGFWQPLGKVAYETTVTKSGQFSILGKTYNIDRLPDNQVVANALAAHPDKFYGWIFINPADTDAQSVIEEYADRPGWIGVKCHRSGINTLSAFWMTSPPCAVPKNCPC